MTPADYLIILLYFAGLLAVGWLLGKRISSSREMFIAGKNSSWWLSGLSTYMTIFSASTFAVWGGVAFKHGLCAAIIGMMIGNGSEDKAQQSSKMHIFGVFFVFELLEEVTGCLCLCRHSSDH